MIVSSLIASSEPAARRSERWMRAARRAWPGLVALVTALFATGLWFLYHELLRPCLTPGCGDDGFSLTAAELADWVARGHSPALYAAYQIALYVVFFAVFCGVGALIYRQGAREPASLVFAYALVLWGGLFPSIPRGLWAALPPVAALMVVLQLVAGLCFYLFFWIFPNGRFVPGRLRWPALVFIVCMQIPPAVAELSGGQAALLRALQAVLFPLFLIGAIAAQVYRYRRVSTPAERRQTRWVLLGVVLGLGVILAIMLGTWLWAPTFPRGATEKMLFTTLVYSGFLLVPLSIGAAMLRAQLWNVDLWVSRTLLYVALSLCLVGLYVVLVGYLGLVFARGTPFGDNLGVALAATGVVALVFQPLRVRLDRVIRRMLFGDRDQPYLALARLGHELEAAPSPDAILPATVDTIRGALKLPYVAIALQPTDDDEGDAEMAAETIVAAVGAPPPNLVALPLSAHGVRVGRLLLAPRTPGEPFSAGDRRLLADLARQAGLAVQSVRLGQGLKRSRERIVAAREEERRRLRRDLHDGLGPTLATLAIEVEAARDLLTTEPVAADTLLADVTAQTQTAIDEIRRLVYALRPPALDDLGLVGAVQAHAARHLGGPVAVTVDASGTLPPLPAAVEVAAYRIVQEALTNVLRHAGAARCTVTIALVGMGELQALAIEIADDGVGLPVDLRAGVGLGAMRERAAEVGGICRVVGAGRGTRVSAWLPLGQREGA